jgi:hypothetical protein
MDSLADGQQDSSTMLGHEAETETEAAPPSMHDELAALEAGWDEILAS